MQLRYLRQERTQMAAVAPVALGKAVSKKARTTLGALKAKATTATAAAPRNTEAAAGAPKSKVATVARAARAATLAATIQPLDQWVVLRGQHRQPLTESTCQPKGSRAPCTPTAAEARRRVAPGPHSCLAERPKLARKPLPGMRPGLRRPPVRTWRKGHRTMAARVRSPAHVRVQCPQLVQLRAPAAAAAAAAVTGSSKSSTRHHQLGSAASLATRTTRAATSGRRR
mmetsp:Transcript_53645/g.166093  ORF Transcript_53645/g.166093 Transcript_53645/m.166093 type:complete len:227 (+) Transcript_53645:490-1170(+)